MCVFKYYLILSLSGYVASEICNTKHFFEDNNCCAFNEPTIEEECTVANRKITWNLEDEKAGEIAVTFSLDSPRCNIETYGLTLYVEESKNSDQCHGIKTRRSQQIFTSNNNIHTKIVYKIKYGNSTCNNKCKQIEKLKFKHIFTGCYFLKIETWPFAIKSTLSTNIFFKTKYIKQTAESINPRVYFTPRSTERNKTSLLIMHFYFPYLQGNPEMKIQIFSEGNVATHSIMPINDEIENNSDLYVCREKSTIFWNISDPKCWYKQKNDGGIECHYFGLREGKYNFIFILRNESVRCQADTLWGQSNICQWDIVKDVFFPVTPEPITWQEISSENTIISSIIISFGIFTALLMAIYILKKLYAKHVWKNIFRSKTQLEVNKQKSVFLLYAKDCDLFMEMMEEFRKLLRSVAKYEVYDLHDVSRSNAINSHPEGWIRDKLQNHKTILIISKCAAIQNTTEPTAPSIYKTPDYSDNYFLFALRYLNRITEIATYQNLLLVQFSFDKNLYPNFNFLNPYTRFDLPDKFLHILADLNDEMVPQLNIDPENIPEYKNNIIFNKFIEKYVEYKEYCENNPNYLENILC